MQQGLKEKAQSREMDINFVRKSKLFHRENMQQLNARDYLKVIVIVGIIVIPVIFGLVI